MTARMPPAQRNVLEAVNKLLERGYAQAAGAVLRTITLQSTGDNTLMQRRLAELMAEAARLAEAGKRLTPENAILRAVLADFDDVMRANQALVAGAAGEVQASGIAVAGQAVRATALPGISDAALRAAGLTWNVPDPEALRALIEYTASSAWQQRLDRYGEGLGTLARDTVVRGMAMGQGPLATAEQLRGVIENLPEAYADTMMRTLQITSYHDAQVVHRVANAHIITEHVRTASLDDRTCMACVALHGTVLRPDERVDDHHNGRCTSVAVVRGRAAPEVEAGPAWFERQPEARQRAMMGDAAYEAWKAGAINLQDYPRRYTDPVFGEMVGAQSLRGMLGDAAREYYAGEKK